MDEDVAFQSTTDERWIGFSTFVPASGKDAYDLGDTSQELIFQLHSDPDVSPFLSLHFDPGDNVRIHFA